MPYDYKVGHSLTTHSLCLRRILLKQIHDILIHFQKPSGFVASIPGGMDMIGKTQSLVSPFLNLTNYTQINQSKQIKAQPANSQFLSWGNRNDQRSGITQSQLNQNWKRPTLKRDFFLPDLRPSTHVPISTTLSDNRGNWN